MWRFQDGQEREWEVVVGRESWGGFWAIFVPVGHGAAIRQTRLGSGSREEAVGELEELDAAGLRRLLEDSEPKESG